jgi:hypothetical protein
VAGGRLVRLDSGVYATPAALADWRVRVAAVVRSRRGVASHGTALALWDLLPPGNGPLHVSVGPGRSGRGSPGVTLHRGTDLDWHVRRVRGISVTSVERSLVDAWGSPAGVGRAAVRGAAITAVRERLCTTSGLAHELAGRPQMPARAALASWCG